MLYLYFVKKYALFGGMARHPNRPKTENVSAADVEAATKASPSQRGFVRMSAVKALCPGFPHNKTARLYDVSTRTLSRWVRWFNDRGIDGRIDRPKPGRAKKIGPEKADPDTDHWFLDRTGVEEHPHLRQRFVAQELFPEPGEFRARLLASIFTGSESHREAPAAYESRVVLGFHCQRQGPPHRPAGTRPELGC